MCELKPQTNEIMLIKFIPNTNNLIALKDNQMKVRRLFIPNEIQHLCDDCLQHIEVCDEFCLPNGLLSIGCDDASGVTKGVLTNSILPEVIIPESVRTIGFLHLE